MIEERFYTTEQVATTLQVHPFTILKFIKQGKLKGIKIGRVYRIQESEVNRFLEERMTSRSIPRVSEKDEKVSVEIQPIEDQMKESDIKIAEIEEIIISKKEIVSPEKKSNENGEHYYII